MLIRSIRIAHAYVAVLVLLISINAQNDNNRQHQQPQTLNLFETVEKTEIRIIGESIEHLSVARFSRNRLFTISDYSLVIDLDTTNYVVRRLGRDLYSPFTGLHQLSLLDNGTMVLNDVDTGISYVLLYGSSGNLLARRRHHPVVRKIVLDKNEAILVGGLHIIGYDEMLAKYDENTFAPSKRSRQGIREFYDRASGYWIIKYDSNLSPVDSLLYTSGNMKEKQRASFRGMFSFDVDSDNTIWSFAYPDNKIKHYSDSGELIYEFELEAEDVNMPQVGLTDRQWRKLERRGDGFFWAFNLHVIHDKIIISYRKKYPNKNAKTQIVAIYTKSGRFVKRGIVNHDLFREGESLYYWRKEDGIHYLVECHP